MMFRFVFFMDRMMWFNLNTFRKAALVIIGCFLYQSISYTQTLRDSLKQSIGYYQEDRELVKEFIRIANENILIDNALAKQYAIEAYTISSEINYPIGEAYALNIKGTLNHIEGDYASAFSSFESAIRICEEIQDTLGLANGNSNLAAVYVSMGEVDKSIESLLLAVGYYKEMNDSLNVGKVLVNIGKAFSEIAEWESAKKYYLEAGTYAKRTNDPGLSA